MNFVISLIIFQKLIIAYNVVSNLKPFISQKLFFKFKTVF